MSQRVQRQPTGSPRRVVAEQGRHQSVAELVEGNRDEQRDQERQQCHHLGDDRVGRQVVRPDDARLVEQQEDEDRQPHPLDRGYAGPSGRRWRRHRSERTRAHDDRGSATVLLGEPAAMPPVYSCNHGQHAVSGRCGRRLGLRRRRDPAPPGTSPVGPGRLCRRRVERRSSVAEFFPSLSGPIADLTIAAFRPTRAARARPALPVAADRPIRVGGHRTCRPTLKVVDVGGDHRFVDGWTYGLTELTGAAAIAELRRGSLIRVAFRPPPCSPWPRCSTRGWSIRSGSSSTPRPASAAPDAAAARPSATPR